MDPSNDAYKPAQIAALIETAGVAKAGLPVLRMMTLAVLAGVFIGFGAAAYLMVMAGADPGDGARRLLGGVSFALGLIMVVVAGAELFTGNALMVMAAVDRKITLRALLRNWAVVYAGNLLGAVGLAMAFGFAGVLDGPVGAGAAKLATAKVALSPLEALLRGALCNALVCLAVWMSVAARSVTDKVLAVVWPVAGFVLLGLEHSVANFFIFPAGIWAGAETTPVQVAGSLVWVTLGNILGGAGGVALAYRLAYGKP